MLNKVQFIGRLGNKPEIREVGQDAKVCNCRIATNEYFYDSQNQKVEKTQWHTLTFWNRSAINISKYANKGDLIYIEGKLIHKNYTNKEGVEKYNTEIEVSTYNFLSSNRKADTSSEENVTENAMAEK